MQRTAEPEALQIGLLGKIQDTQFEFQINNKFILIICPEYCMGHNYTKITYHLPEIQV